MQEQLEEINARIDSLEERHVLTAEELVELRSLINSAVETLQQAVKNQAEMMKDNREFLDIYRNFRATVKVFGAVERIAVWIVKIGGAATIIWGIVKYGVMAMFKQGD